MLKRLGTLNLAAPLTWPKPMAAVKAAALANCSLVGRQVHRYIFTGFSTQFRSIAHVTWRRSPLHRISYEPWPPKKLPTSLVLMTGFSASRSPPPCSSSQVHPSSSNKLRPVRYLARPASVCQRCHVPKCHLHQVAVSEASGPFIFTTIYCDLM